MSRDQPISPSQTPNDAGDEVAVKPQPSEPIVYRSNRPSRACTLRAAAKLQQATANNDRSHKPKKDNRHRQKQRRRRQEEAEEVGEDGGYESPPCEEKCSGSGSSKIVTSLVAPPEPAQLSRWNLRSMWELASVLNFLHVFRPFLNIPVEFSAEEFETALLTPNYTLGSIHMPLLKAIPPITRSALTQDTWITVLCKKLKDWWHWVADGDLPIVASHGLEIEEYKSLDPGVRVVILKALCDIRVEQEDIRSYIDSSIKQGAQLSLFRKERIGGDSHGISYWYEPDELVGFRLYREIRKTELPAKGKARGSKVLPSTVYQWETVATNYDEFLHVSEKLFASENRTEVSLGKKLKNDKLPEIEKVHKRKERLLKKQHREALLLDNYLSVDGLAAGRSLRDRKHVTYTFDDYDRSINEAIKVTKKKPPSPEHVSRREGMFRREASSNGGTSGPSYTPNDGAFSAMSPMSSDYDGNASDHEPEDLDRGNRRRQRPQRYSEKDYVEAISDNEANSEDDIEGEAVYDEEYLRKRKQRKLSSGSEGDEEYKWDGENGEEEEEEDEDSLSISEESDQPRKSRKLPGRTRRETKLISSDKFRSGLRRSKRSTRNRIDYKQYELSDSETDAAKKRVKLDASENHSDASENENSSAGSQDYEDNDNGNGNDSDVEDDEYDDDGNNADDDIGNDDDDDKNDDDDDDNSNGDEQDSKVDQADEGYSEPAVKEETKPPAKPSSSGQDDIDGVKKTRFLDLNELAPGSGFEDSPSTLMKDEDRDDF